MNVREDKKIITVQIPSDLYNELTIEAASKMLTLSAYLRLLILERAKNEQNN